MADVEVEPITQTNADEIQILGELVGGYNLSNEEHVQGLKDKHLRPYCIVKFQDKTIHYSSPCTETGRDPIWTVSTGSLFLFKVCPRALLTGKLQISIWSKRNSNSLRGKVLLDMDTFFLGKASMNGKTLFSHCNEERIELPLMDLHGNQSLAESNLALRFRLATKSDIKLLTLLQDQGISPPTLTNKSFRKSQSSRLGIQENPVKDLILGEGSKLPFASMVTEEIEQKLAYFTDALSFAFRTTTMHDPQTGLRKLRIKPFADPTRVEETTFMSPLEISKETMKPSQHWVEAGSGHVGTLHLEILSCHDLPNVDVGEAVGNLSDCFACAVFEDVMVQTPVIDDELSPHWLPWTQRAFRIGIVHPASTLFLGILDYDLGPGTHEPIGRVAVNLSNFQSNTLYTLTFSLHPTSELADRAANGSITVRLRIEYHDEKATVMAALQPRPCFHVNTRTNKTFKVVRYTCFGEYDDEEQFTWAVTKSYIGEILEYWRGLKFYVGQSLHSLVFWKGQVTICKMHLPIHSAVMFVSCAILVERPWLIVPFYSLFVAWFLLATMSHRRETPSPWRTCNSFLHYAELILTGKASDTRERIRKSEQWDNTQAYEKSMSEWREKYQSEVDEKAAMDEKLMTIGNENISTAVAAQLLPMDLLIRLGRYQGTVGRLCKKFRTLKSILIWEESLTSFWITAVCLMGGLVGLLLPWKFILYHGGRTIVWGFMGPHMKIVDAYLHTPSNGDSKKAAVEFRNQSRLARIRREDAWKLKDLKCLTYGEFVTLIPSFNLPRHYDRPLHMSSAIYVAPSATADNIPATSRIPGQQLYGTMIPHTKSGVSSLEEESKEVQAKLVKLGEQMARLESIESHVSTRHIQTDDDNELPDDLGYEISICNETNAIEKDDEDAPPRMPSDFRSSLSMSQIGFQVGNVSEADLLLGFDLDQRGQFSRPARRLMSASIPEEEKKESWDMEDDMDESDCDESNGLFDEDKGNQVFLTPLQTHPGQLDDDDEKLIPFLTPEQDTHNEPQPTESAKSPLRFLELKLKEINCAKGTEEEEPLTQEVATNKLAGRSKDTANAIAEAEIDDNDNENEKDHKDDPLCVKSADDKLPPRSEDDRVIRQTWSASELREEKAWIKASASDSILHCSKASQHHSSVKIEEGLEVVAMGRLRTIGDEDEEEDKDETGNSADDAAELSDEPESSSHHGLSAPYASSNDVQVVTFRP